MGVVEATYTGATNDWAVAGERDDVEVLALRDQDIISSSKSILFSVVGQQFLARFHQYPSHQAREMI